LEGGGFPLIPCTNRDWPAYIWQQLKPNESHEYESHLYACDACLQVYMDTVDSLPQLSKVNAIPAIIDHIMGEIQSVTEKKKQVPLIRRPLFQYGVAAAITLVLMSAGAFQGLSMQISHIESTTNKGEQESYSQKLMEKTVSMLDAIQTQPKGGQNP
jgi:hypothetical protein